MTARLRNEARDFFSFNIGKPENLKPLIQRINRAAAASGPHTNINLFMGDIKQMYTELEHDELKKEVKWLILKFQTRFGRGVTLKVKRHPSKEPNQRDMNVVLGTSCVSKKRYYEITMTELDAIVRFDIDNTFFKIGSQIYRQVRGIPMGSNLSPALAYLICTYYERRIPKTTPAYRLSRVFGARYMDDILIIRLLSAHDTELNELLHTDLQRIIDTSRPDSIYHPRLHIKQELDPRGVACLGSLIYKKDNGLLCIRYLNRNEVALTTAKTQNILRFQHRLSYTPVQQQVGVMIGKFTRILRMTSEWPDVLTQASLLTQEFGSLGYALKMVSQTLLNKFNQAFHPHWRLLSQHLNSGII